MKIVMKKQSVKILIYLNKVQNNKRNINQIRKDLNVHTGWINKKINCLKEQGLVVKKRMKKRIGMNKRDWNVILTKKGLKVSNLLFRIREVLEE